MLCTFNFGNAPYAPIGIIPSKDSEFSGSNLPKLLGNAYTCAHARDAHMPKQGEKIERIIRWAFHCDVAMVAEIYLLVNRLTKFRSKERYKRVRL